MVTDKDFKMLLSLVRKQSEEIKELKALLLQHPKLAQPEVFLSTEQAARQLGVGKTKMAEMLRKGELPFATKVGKKWRFSQTELERYISRN